MLEIKTTESWRISLMKLPLNSTHLRKEYVDLIYVKISYQKKKPEENYNVITSDICCLQQLISKKTLNKVGYVEHLKIQIQIPLSQFNKF